MLFCKPSNIDDLPLKLPSLTINEVAIDRVYDIKFLGVILNETLNWRKHIEVIENKISKNIGILFKAKPFLQTKPLKQLYFSFINSYIDYCNAAWGATYKTNLKKIFNKQKHALRVIFGQDRYTNVQNRFKEIGALDLYKMNLYKTAIFMFKTHNGLNPILFKSQFKQIDHKYITRYSNCAYLIPKANLKCHRFCIRYRGPLIWNSLTKKQKEQTSLESFKSLLKQYYLNLTSDIEKYFWNVSTIFSFSFSFHFFKSFNFSSSSIEYSYLDIL